MTIRYVDGIATGAADGTSWADAYTTMSSAATASSAGDELILSGGTSGQTYNERLGIVTNKSLTIRGVYPSDTDYSSHNGLVKIDSTGDADHMFRAEGTTGFTLKRMWLAGVDATKYILNNRSTGNHLLEELIVTGRAGRLITISDVSTGITTIRNCRIFDIGYMAVNIDDLSVGTLNIEQSCIGEMHSQSTIQVAGGTVDINIRNTAFGNGSGIIVKTLAAYSGNVTIDNSILSPSGDTSALNSHTLDHGGSGSFTVNNSVVMPAWRGTGEFNGIITFNNCIGDTDNDDVSVKTVAPRRGYGSISMMIDDAGRFDDNGSGLSDAEVFANVCEASGVRASYCVEVAAVTTARLAVIVKLIKLGHSVSSHGMTGARLNDANLPAFDIQYSGAATAATMTIASDVLTLKEDAATVATITLNDVKVTTQVISIINALTDWSCTTAAAGTDAWISASKSLADVADQDVKTASYEANMDGDRYYDYELRESRLLLDTLIRPYVPEYACTTHVYSIENGDSSSEQASFDAGYLSSRGNLTNPWSWYDANGGGGLRPHLAYGQHLSTIPYSPSDVTDLTRKISAMGEYVKFSGAIINLYNHNLTGTVPTDPPTTEAHWTTIIAALVATGVSIKTYDQQAVDMRDGATALTANLEYTRDFTATDSTYTPQLTSGSQAVGIGKKWWTGPEPVGLGGEPFSDSNTDAGSVASQHGAFHPVNL